jgi:hypothetical protein
VFPAKTSAVQKVLPREAGHHALIQKAVDIPASGLSGSEANGTFAAREALL